MEQLIDLSGFDTEHRLALGDEPFAHHVDSDLHRRFGGALAAARLEHEELAALDGELHVLHVAVVLLELSRDLLELPVGFGEILRHRGDRLRRPDPGDDVLTLRVGQVFAVQLPLPGRWIAGESDAGSRVVTHVPEHHRLDVDRGAEVMRNAVVVAIVGGSLVVPRLEHRADRRTQLLHGILGKPHTRVALDDRPVLGDQLLERRRAEVGIGLRLLALLDRVERFLEELTVDSENDLAEQLDEPAMRVERETPVLGQRSKTLERGRVEAEVEDRVHHSGHREFRSAADTHEERIARVAKTLAGGLLDDLERLLHLLPEAVGKLPAPGVKGVAGLGRDREAGWNGKTGPGHLGDARPLAAQQVTHRSTALVEAVHPFVCARPDGHVPRGPAAGCGGARPRFRRLRAPGAYRHSPALTMMVVACAKAPRKA